jgi:hypothetical protein
MSLIATVRMLAALFAGFGCLLAISSEVSAFSLSRNSEFIGSGYSSSPMLALAPACSVYPAIPCVVVKMHERRLNYNFLCVSVPRQDKREIL